MHDGAKAHTARMTNAWIARNGLKSLQGWPAKSPDLNGIEAAWSLLKRNVSATLPGDEAELEASIRKVWASIPQSTIDSWCGKYNSHAPHVLRSKGLW
jgi:transposase